MKKNNITIIAEVAQAHDGSLGIAHSFIDAVSKAGADGIKYQTHIAEFETTVDEPWRVKFSQQDKTRFDYWKRMEFTEKQWVGLKKHADKKGILFLSSPFSIEAFELLNRVGVHAWKVASGEITNYPLLEKMAKTGVPMWISTGMSGYQELDNIVTIMKNFKANFTLLQCTSAYPVKPEEVGINLIGELKNKYNCQVGLSDHSGMIFPSLAAAVLGASIIEVHVTFSKEMFGPDVPASLTIDELHELVKGVRFIEKMMNNPVDKEASSKKMSEMRRIFMKRIITCQSMKKGDILTDTNITTKKSNIGISAIHWPDIIGKTAATDLSEDHFINWKDIEY